MESAASADGGSRYSRRTLYKGVSKSGDSWKAVVLHYGGQVVELGFFDTEEAAARGVDIENLRFAQKNPKAPKPELNFADSKLSDDEHEDSCCVCDEGGTLLCCDKCSAVFHLDCLVPPLDEIPSEEWCVRCQW